MDSYYKPEDLLKFETIGKDSPDLAKKFFDSIKEKNKELICKCANELKEKLGDDKSWIEYTNYIISNNLSYMNDKITRNEGLIKSIKTD